MPQFRLNPITGQWVSIAPNRAERPSDFDDASLPGAVKECPFCEGNESSTPDEILALRPEHTKPNTPGWTVRVVNNKYPFVSQNAETDQLTPIDSLCIAQPGLGVQEVIVESPRHVANVTDLSAAEWIDVLSVYRMRLAQLQTDERWAYALLFKNSGSAAGASLSHVHSQMITLPFIPPIVAASVAHLKEHFQSTDRHLLLDIVNRELEAGERVVIETEHFVALCPFASRQPYEMLVIPKQRAANFSEITEQTQSDLAALLRNLIARLESVLPTPAFNWMFHTSPFDTNSQAYYHWHVEIVPRVTNTAGYEWATANAVNIVAPEAAASQLRQASGQAEKV